MNRNILRRLHYVLWQSQAKLTIEVNNLETLLMEVAQRSADQNNYILVIYGSRFSEELRNWSISRKGMTRLAYMLMYRPG